MRRSGRWYLPCSGCTGSIRCHCDAHLRQPADRAGGSPGDRSDAMWSSSTRTVTPRCDGGLERVEERRGRVVEREDVELDVHVPLRRCADAHPSSPRSTPRSRRSSVGRVAADQRHRAEVAVQLDDRLAARSATVASRAHAARCPRWSRGCSVLISRLLLAALLAAACVLPISRNSRMPMYGRKKMASSHAIAVCGRRLRGTKMTASTRHRDGRRTMHSDDERRPSSQ